MLKVLIVDDIQGVRICLIFDLMQLYKTVFGEKTVLRISEVEDIRGAIAALEECPDIIFCDINLGQESGLFLIKRMKETRPDLIIVGMSADDRNQQLALEAGASMFLLKEVGFDRNKVKEALELILQPSVV